MQLAQGSLQHVGLTIIKTGPKLSFLLGSQYTSRYLLLYAHDSN